MAFFWLLLSLASAFELVSANTYVTVNTNLGKIRGVVKELNDCQKVNQFFGVPYAKPPTGPLRWKEPVPVEQWSGVLDASTLYPSHCPQVKAFFPDDVKVRFEVFGTMSEDCLSLNIYSPNGATSQSNLPVMVYIHGGGFMGGSAFDGDGTFLAALTGVVMVSINYRLGVLGFASFPGTTTTGNYGLFDQVMALKWIKNNIASFGGNPDSITLFGFSAGGASVAHLSLSPLANGLFQRAVSQSGTPATYWSLYESQDYWFIKELGEEMDCTGLMGEIRACLQDKPVDEILSAQEKLSLKSIFLFIPRIDGKFLPEHPNKLIQRGEINDVEHIIGVSENEADMMLYLMNLNSIPLSVVVTIFAGDQAQAVQDAIIHEYTLHGEHIGAKKQLLRSSELVTDYGYNSAADAWAHALSGAGKNVYFYVFAHRNEHTVYPDWVRVSHGEDVGYTMGMPLNGTSPAFYTADGYTEMEKGLSRTVMKLWSNFAKTGDPSSPEDGIEWPRFTTEEPDYLKITLRPEVRRGLKPKAMAFWNGYIPKLRKHVEEE